MWNRTTSFVRFIIITALFVGIWFGIDYLKENGYIPNNSPIEKKK